MNAEQCNPNSYAIPTTLYTEQSVMVWDQICAVARIVKYPLSVVSRLYWWLTETNPKSPPPCAPGHGLLGSIPELAARKWNIIQFLHDYQQAYGQKGLCEVNLGTRTFYIVTDPQMVQQILQKHESFVRGESLEVWRKFSPGGLSEGADTQSYRQKAIGAIAPKELPHYFPGIVHVSNEWLDRLSAFPRGEAFDLIHYCERATLAAMGSSLFKREPENPEEPNPFGLSVNDDVDCDRFLHAFHRLFELITVRITSGVANIPIFGDTVYAKLHKKEEEEFSTIKNTLKDILEPIFKNLLRDPETIPPASHFHKIMTNFGINLADPDYPDILNKSLGFLQASFETSSKAFGWTLYHLSRDQELQQRLREAIFEKLNGQNPENLGALKNIPLLEQVIEEILRLFPPFPFLLRDIKNRKEFTAFKVKEGGTFIISPLLIQRIESIWGENAHCFAPDHFAEEKDRSDTQQLKDPRYLTFLGGIHRCPGRHFAKQELMILIAKFLMRFKIYPENPHAPPTGLKFNITLQPETPIYVIIEEVRRE